MPARGTVTAKGLREFIRAADASGKATKKAVRDRLRKVGEIVRDDARGLFASYDERTASRFGVSVRRTGVVSVEQRLRRTTGKRPDFGGLQMRKALLPALEQDKDKVEREFERALDDIADIFERG